MDFEGRMGLEPRIVYAPHRIQLTGSASADEGLSVIVSEPAIVKSLEVEVVEVEADEIEI